MPVTMGGTQMMEVVLCRFNDLDVAFCHKQKYIGEQPHLMTALLDTLHEETGIMGFKVTYQVRAS